MSEKVIAERRQFSDAKLAEIRKSIQDLESLKECPELCVYATGSFARLDAGQHSDLDIFFVTTGQTPRRRIQQFLINADIIRICRNLGLPEFSGDGQYLTFHTLDSLVREAGSQKEDYENFFTARLLLLLESAPLHNPEVYESAVSECVRAYYRDYHDHTANFRPVFLANDITRFWKTLCLNYEHKRNRRDKPEDAKRKSHLKNFKLKFSRLLTCFSMVACLCDPKEAAHPDQAIQLVRITPLDRMERIVAKHGLQDLWGRMRDLYGWFLQTTDRRPEEAEAWIARREVRNEVFPRAEVFGNMMYELLGQVAQQSQGSLRYLVV